MLEGREFVFVCSQLHRADVLILLLVLLLLLVLVLVLLVLLVLVLVRAIARLARRRPSGLRALCRALRRLGLLHCRGETLRTSPLRDRASLGRAATLSASFGFPLGLRRVHQRRLEAGAEREYQLGAMLLLKRLLKRLDAILDLHGRVGRACTEQRRHGGVEPGAAVVAQRSRGLSVSPPERSHHELEQKRVARARAVRGTASARAGARLGLGLGRRLTDGDRVEGCEGRGSFGGGLD